MFDQRLRVLAGLWELLLAAGERGTEVQGLGYERVEPFKVAVVWDTVEWVELSVWVK